MDKFFDEWWELTGKRFAQNIQLQAVRAGGWPHHFAPLEIGKVYESIKALCSVAYHQGRCDAGCLILADIQAMTSLQDVTPVKETPPRR